MTFACAICHKEREVITVTYGCYSLNVCNQCKQKAIKELEESYKKQHCIKCNRIFPFQKYINNMCESCYRMSNILSLFK